MRHEKAEGLLELARLLGSTAEGLTLDEMATAAGVGRRTAERMRDALEALFPQMEVLADGAIKRFNFSADISATKPLSGRADDGWRYFLTASARY